MSIINPCLGSLTIAGLDLTYSTIPVPGLTGTVVDTKVGNDFRFKGFIPGVGILIDELTNPGAITITATGASQAYTYSTEVVPGVTSTVVGTQVGQNFGFRPVAGFGDVIVNNTTVPGTLSIGSNVTFSTNPVVGVTASVVDTKIGSNFNFRGFIPGSNITLDQVSQPGAIIISATGGGPVSQLFQNNTLFVDQQFGNDSTGTRERRDLPYQTLQAAISASLVGDTIHVFPGNYTGPYSITQGLNIYAENGVFFSGLGPSIFSVTSPNPFRLAGYSKINVISNQSGFLINSNAQTIDVELDNVTTTTGPSKTIFDIVDFGGTLAVNMQYLNIVTGVYCNANVVAGPNFKVISKIKRTEISGSILTSVGVLSLFEFYCDTIRYLGGGELLRYSGESAYIFFKGRYIEFISTTPGVYYFTLSDTTPPGSPSEVSMRIEFDEINYETSNRTLFVSSNKIGSGYPVAEFLAKRIVHNPSGFNGILYGASNGDIILSTDTFEWVTSTNNSGFILTNGGSISINCSTSFRQTGTTTTSLYIINAINVYINAPIFEVNGRIMSNNGYINSQNMILNSNTTLLEGNWQLSGDIVTFTTPVTSLLLTAGVNVSILAQKISFNGSTSTISCSNATLNIKCQELSFVNTSGSDINLTNTSVLVIDSNVVTDMVVNMVGAGTRTYLRCSRYVATSAKNNIRFVLNGGTLELSADDINISANLQLIGLGAGSIAYMKSTNIFTTANVPLVSTFATGTVLEAYIGSLEAAPSNSTSIFNFSQTIAHIAINNLSVLNSNLNSLFFNLGASTIKFFADQVNIPSTIINLNAGAGMLMRCGKCRVTSNQAVITSSGLLEMSGNYTTNGLNVVVANSPNITIGPSKLVSTAACIVGSAANVYVIPSLASFASAVPIIGTIITNPGLPA